MKNDRLTLYKWENRFTDIIDVPWPKIHQELGSDQVAWLLNQPKDRCQLVVDKLNEQLCLVVEFYNAAAVTDYYLRWAK